MVKEGVCCRCREAPRAKNCGYCRACRTRYHRERRWQQDKELRALRVRVKELEAVMAKRPLA